MNFAIPWKPVTRRKARLWPGNFNDSSDGAKVVYESKDGETTKTFDALDWPRR